VRVFVIQFLAEQSCCYSGDLTDILPIAKSTLSQHLKELKEAGLIEGELETPKIRYCLHKENWEIAKENLKSFINIDISCSSDCK
jgi:DNA-binding transcriptional ArsR family regulator